MIQIELIDLISDTRYAKKKIHTHNYKKNGLVRITKWRQINLIRLFYLSLILILYLVVWHPGDHPESRQDKISTATPNTKSSRSLNYDQSDPRLINLTLLLSAIA